MSNARTMPKGWHPAPGADYSVQVIPLPAADGSRGIHVYDIAPYGWADSCRMEDDTRLMQGPDDRVKARY